MKIKKFHTFLAIGAIAGITFLVTQISTNNALFEGYLSWNPKNASQQKIQQFLPSAQNIPHMAQPGDARIGLTYNNNPVYGTQGLTYNPDSFQSAGENFNMPSLGNIAPTSSAPSSPPNPFVLTSSTPTTPSTEPTQPTRTPPSTQPNSSNPTPSSTQPGSPTSPPATTYKGSCIVRDAFTNLPFYFSADAARGYAKMNKGMNFLSFADIDTVCTQYDYALLRQTFCAQNPHASYKKEVAMYNQTDSLNMLGASKWGSGFERCP